jgi:hypothetical protein
MAVALFLEQLHRHQNLSAKLFRLRPAGQCGWRDRRKYCQKPSFLLAHGDARNRAPAAVRG